jgi:ribonucleotide reductase beta subunit family protein with ferritin-like domain
VGWEKGEGWTVIQVFPRIEDSKIMELFRKGVEGQWSAASIDWKHPVQLDQREKRAFARILTPVYLGEQTAMIGASSVIPQFFAAHHTEAQLYLATFLLDEARHFEALTRFYQTIEMRPLEVRDLKEILRYQVRLFKSRDKIEWLWGILISDILARHFYGTLVKAHPDSLFAQIGSRILLDEARHLAFAELYLKAALARQPELAPKFLAMRDDLLWLMHAIYAALKEDANVVGVDGNRLLAAVGDDIEKKVRRLHLPEPLEDELV